MDTGSKTLAQLSEESKEKKYVTLETGSKISGYTKDYLERLCRLNMVEYRLWSNGSFVIELESLLRETHAILLSFEGVTFVDRNELTDPIPQVVGNILSSVLKTIESPALAKPATSFEDSSAFKSGMAQAVPTFGQTLSAKTEPVSFVGRAVFSDALHPEEQKNDVKKSEMISSVLPQSVSQADDSAPLPSIPTPPQEEAVRVPIRQFNLEAIRETSTAPSLQEKTVAEKVHEHIPIKAINSPEDEWDEHLIGTKSEIHTGAPRHIPIVKDTSEASVPPEVQVNSDTNTHDTTLLTPITHHGVPVSAVNDETEHVVATTQKVVVFSDHKTSVPVSSDRDTTPVQKNQHEQQQGMLLTTPTTTSVISAPMTPLPVQKNPIPILTSTPELLIPNKKIDAPIAMHNSAMPMLQIEHHLAKYETHPLMKSTGFNMVFAVMLIVASFMTLGGKVLENVGGSVNTASYVAGVGAISGSIPDSEKNTTADSQSSQVDKPLILPFSNEITATSGASVDTVIIQPIFEHGKGKSYQYILVPESVATATLITH